VTWLSDVAPHSDPSAPLPLARYILPIFRSERTRTAPPTDISSSLLLSVCFVPFVVNPPHVSRTGR